MLSFEEYRRYDALGLAELVRKGAHVPQELLECAIRRIDEVNIVLNAVIHTFYDEARVQSKSVDTSAPFCGVPFLVKDLGMAVKGTPLRMGCRGYANNISKQDSHAVQKMRQAGFLIFGKTNTPEFGLAPYTEPKTFGGTRNPRNPKYSPAGSSGGSAAAVASGIVPMATANDGGGSIRMPASACGLFGLKPTRGRVSWSGLYGEMWSGASVEGCVSRSVRDTAAYLDVISGSGPGDPYISAQPQRPYLQEVNIAPGKLRIGWSLTHTIGQRVDAACKTAVEHALEVLRQEGHTVEEVALPYQREDLTEAFIVIVAAETAADVAALSQHLGYKAGPGDVEANTYALALLGRSFTAADYALAKRRWHELSQRMVDFHEKYDVLVTPTLARCPIRLGALQNSKVENALLIVVNALGLGSIVRASLNQLIEKIYGYMPWTPFANMTGQPSMSIPFYQTEEEKLPIGVMFTGRMGQEDLLLRLAGQLERVAPWDKITEN